MKTFIKSLASNMNGSVIMATCICLVIFFNLTFAHAQIVTNKNPQNATLTPNDGGGIDKSNLRIHNNIRDESTHHINNRHLFVNGVHHRHIVRTGHGRGGHIGKGPKRTIKNLHRHK